MDEPVDIIDEHGTLVRRVMKSEAHAHGWLHKTVIGYVRRDDNWVLVRQASDKQDAGQLVAPVGGHITAGETEVEALLREAEEEIGTRNISYTYLGSARFHRQVVGRDENHLFVVFEISTNDTIVLNEESVSLETFTSEQLRQALQKSPQNFGDGYYFVLEHFYPSYLPQRYKRRWLA
jgi:8-oxo-dGTP pyrophosphatase MutT (NUDIX family)